MNQTKVKILIKRVFDVSGVFWCVFLTKWIKFKSLWQSWRALKQKAGSCLKSGDGVSDEGWRITGRGEDQVFEASGSTRRFRTCGFRKATTRVTFHEMEQKFGFWFTLHSGFKYFGLIKGGTSVDFFYC